LYLNVFDSDEARIEKDESAYMDLELVIPALHIHYKEQLEHLHELLRTANKSEFSWDHFAASWLFMNIITYSKEFDIKYTDNILPSLLLLNITKNQIIS
jgi:hypothetical protein